MRLVTTTATLGQELTMARGDGRYAKLLASRAKVELLLIDDGGMVTCNTGNQRDLLEVLEDR